MKTREINIILAFPGTCMDVTPTESNFTVVSNFEDPVNGDIEARTEQAVGVMSVIKDTMSKTDDSIMFIIPWSEEMRAQLISEKMNFTTILPKTDKVQDWFMRLIDSGYGFNRAASALVNFGATTIYKIGYPYETIYRLETDRDLDFKDLRTLIQHGKIRVLEFKIFLSDMIPYPEIFAFWFIWCVCMFIGMRDKLEWLLSCIQTFVYTAGLNYVFKSTIMRRRGRKNGK